MSWVVIFCSAKCSCLYAQGNCCSYSFHSHWGIEWRAVLCNKRSGPGTLKKNYETVHRYKFMKRNLKTKQVHFHFLLSFTIIWRPELEILVLLTFLVLVLWLMNNMTAVMNPPLHLVFSRTSYPVCQYLKISIIYNDASLL